MNFSSERDSTAGTAMETLIGKCDTPDGRVMCVRKQYYEDDFDEIAENTRKYREVIDKFGPKVYLIDNESRSIIMEYIPGKTLSDVLTKEINPWEQEGFDTLKVLIRNVHKVLSELHSDGFCHEDVNLGNILVQDDLEVRLIDFDGVRPIDQDEVDLPYECEDMLFISGHFTDALDDNIITRERKSQAKFNAQRESIEEVLSAADVNGLLF